MPEFRIDRKLFFALTVLLAVAAGCRGRNTVQHESSSDSRHAGLPADVRSVPVESGPLYETSPVVPTPPGTEAFVPPQVPGVFEEPPAPRLATPGVERTSATGSDFGHSRPSSPKAISLREVVGVLRR